jgi:NDP-sugar pyrophosphorylase family protein
LDRNDSSSITRYHIHMIREAVILAGGQGTRLRPVTLEIPKPLVTVQGVPIATWLVRLFGMHGIERVTVIYPTKWKQRFMEWASSFPSGHAPHVELFEEVEPMGTLGALVHEVGHGTDPIFVTNGDELKGLDLSALAEFHAARRGETGVHAATIALVRVPNPSDYGVAELDGHRIVRFHEKPKDPPTPFISSGLYVVLRRLPRPKPARSQIF